MRKGKGSDAFILSRELRYGVCYMIYLVQYFFFFGPEKVLRDCISIVNLKHKYFIVSECPFGPSSNFLFPNTLKSAWYHLKK